MDVRSHKGPVLVRGQSGQFFTTFYTQLSQKTYGIFKLTFLTPFLVLDKSIQHGFLGSKSLRLTNTY